MRLARPIADADGRLIAGTGTQLSPSVVRALRKLAIQTVPVVESDDVASWVRTRPLADELRGLEDPDVDFDHVAQLIEIDQALTAQVLRVANSAFYSTQATVSRVSEALMILGTVVTRSVVLSTTVFDPSAIRLRGFFEHALGCA